MPRGKKKTIKPVKVNDKVIKDAERELNKDIEKEQEGIIEPVTFQYVGNLKETTTIIGKIIRNNPFTVSDANQINHFRNLNTFEELPKKYKVKEIIGIADPGDIEGMLESGQIDSDYVGKVIDDLLDETIKKSEKDEVVKE